MTEIKCAQDLVDIGIVLEDHQRRILEEIRRVIMRSITIGSNENDGLPEKNEENSNGEIGNLVVIRMKSTVS